jgi:hypothetical protein
MAFPEVAFAISLVFGLHVLISLFLSRPVPVFSILLHLFGFLIGFILINTSGDAWNNTVMTIGSISFILAFAGGFLFLVEDAIAVKPPSKFLGVGYMTLLTVGLILLIIK